MGMKNDILRALKVLLTKKTQWTDYMEEVLQLITIDNKTDNNRERRQIMIQRCFPYRIYDIILPQCNTGYVYMLISMMDFSFAYIGMIICLQSRI